MALLVKKAITSAGEPFTRKHYAKMLLICVSYANLCFLNVWAEIADYQYDFLRKYSTTWRTVAAVTLDVFLLAFVVWGVLSLAVSMGNPRWIRAVKWGAIAGLIIPLNILRTDENVVSMEKVYHLNSPVMQLSILALAATGGLLLLWNWEKLSTRIASYLLILLAPCVPLVFANSALRAWKAPPGAYCPDRPLRAAMPQAPGAPRVIWVIFDEWDQSLISQTRPAGLLLPELDRFRKVAISAGRTYPPAQSTILSVPALLTGRRFSAFTHPAPDDLILTPVSGGGTVALASQPTIFSEARQKGFNVGIAGWYLPYCRLFPDCTACSWSPFALTQGEVSDSQSMPQMMASLFLGQVREIPFCNRLGLKARESARNREFHAGAYWQIHREMLRDAVDPRLNLVYVHMCVPHLPAIYVAAHDTFTSGGGSTYIDNLRLVDRTIGDLRRTLEAHGMWDASTILLTADHPLRVAYWPKAALAPGPIEQHAEVPYLLKLAGQKQALSYDKPLQELVTKNLLLAILARQITVPEDVPAWLEQHPPAQ